MSPWRDELLARLQSLQLRPEREAEIVEELSQHLDDAVRELVAGGTASEAARQTALADLDAPGELARRLGVMEARSPYQLPPPGAPSRGRWLGALWQDVRYAIRSLRRTPGFTVTVVAALALTIGPTTAILSIGNWLVWRPAPAVVQPNRLAVVWFGEWMNRGSVVGVSPSRVSDLNLTDLRRASRTMTGMAGWQESSVSLSAEGVPPRQVGSAHAAVNYFDLLGVRPAAGRVFNLEEDQPPFGSPVVVIGDRLARGVFGSAEAAVGRSIKVNGRPLSVIGVMPPGFVGARPFSQVDVWFPSSTYYYLNHFSETAMQSRTGRASSGIFYTFVVRLATGATFEALQAELDVLVPALATQYPNENRDFTTVRARAYPGLGPDELLRDDYGKLVRNLLMIGGVLLLLGCANVANLLISKGVRRQREHAVRVALGASRQRLVQLLLTESCLLAVAGAALGVGLALWLKGVIQTLLLPGAVGPLADITVPLDVRVLLATLGVSIACGVVAGIAPALLGSSRRVGGTLSRGDLRTSTGGSRVRVGLAVAQLALSLALVTNATLLVATLRNLASVDLGFDPRGVSLHSVDLRSHGYNADRALAYEREFLDRVSSDAALPDVSLSVSRPPGCGLGTRVRDPHGDERATIDVCAEFVTDGFFRTLGVPLFQGRMFTRAEAVASSNPAGTPAVLGAALARRLFGDANALGQRVGMPATRSVPAHDLVVVGVVRDFRSALSDETELRLFTPFAYGGSFSVSRPLIMVRSVRPLREVAERVQAHATAIDSSLPLAPARLLTAALERPLANRRAFAWVLTMLGALGFVLAAVGLYGLLAQMVNERTREFGIRMAMGADRAHVFGLVLRQASWIALLGGVAGLGLGALGSRLVEAQLFGVSRLEPWVYAGSVAFFAAVIFAASAWPARSATRIQPTEALRSE